MSAPAFYTPAAETASVVRCHRGHEMSRETALIVGQQNYARWGCPYCIYTDRERQIALRAHQVGSQRKNPGTE